MTYKLRPLPHSLLAHNFLKGERNVNGIIIPDDDRKSSGIRPRWAQVYAVGADNQKDFKEGDWILIEHGRWSRQINIAKPGDEEYLIWQVEPTSVLLVSDEKPQDDTFGLSDTL